jgi:hypothetical protein
MYPAAIARLVLNDKRPLAREVAATITRRGKPHSSNSDRISEGLRRLYAMSEEAQREHHFVRRAKYLINCLVTVGDRRVFHLDRLKHDDGTPTTVHVEVPIDAHPIELLLRIMRDPAASLVLRLDCAKTAARYLYPREGARGQRRRGSPMKPERRNLKRQQSQLRKGHRS